MEAPFKERLLYKVRTPPLVWFSPGNGRSVFGTFHSVQTQKIGEKERNASGAGIISEMPNRPLY